MSTQFSIDQQYDFLVSMIGKLSLAIDQAADHAMLADLAHFSRKSADDLKQLSTELNKLKMKASVKAAKLIDDEQTQQMMKNQPLPKNYFSDTCSYMPKFEVSYRVEDYERFCNVFGQTNLLTLVSERLFTPHYPNICAFLEANDVTFVPGVVVERFPTILTRKLTANQAEIPASERTVTS